MDVQFTTPPHPATLPLEQLRKDCRWERVRRSGPGGQHRNKVETGVVIRHLPTGIRGEATERRSQAANLEQAIQRLRVQLAVCVRAATAGAASDSTSPLWSRRVPGKRIVVSEGHQDYPAMLAEALDAVSCANFDLNQAAEQLSVSNSQLQKFLRPVALAWQWIQQERVTRGLPRIR